MYVVANEWLCCCWHYLEQGLSEWERGKSDETKEIKGKSYCPEFQYKFMMYFLSLKRSRQMPDFVAMSNTSTTVTQYHFPLKELRASGEMTDSRIRVEK